MHLGEGGKQGEIKLFKNNIDQWDKVCIAKEKRESSARFSKYNKVTDKLQRSFEINHGYHVLCYKNFTAISQPAAANESQGEPSTSRSTRSNSTTLQTSSTGCLPSLCIFCEKKRKKIKGKWENLGKSESETAEKAIRNLAIDLKDGNLLLKIGNLKHGDGPDFVAMEVQYHHSC